MRALMRTLEWWVREPVVMAVILVNGVALFMLAYDPPGGESATWLGIDYACVAYFLAEALIKIRLHGLRGYLADNWNKLDFAIVAISLPFLLTPIVDFHELGGITVLRLLRLFRLFRLMRFIPDRTKLAAGIVRSLRASLGVLTGVLLVNLILALGATMLFGDLVPEYFGNPLIACYSMFQIFTVEGWQEVPALIASRTDSDAWAFFARVYFVGSVFGGGILGLSLANAVFVDQMVLDNNDELEVRLAELTREIRQLRAEIAAGRSSDGGEGPPRTS